MDTHVVATCVGNDEAKTFVNEPFFDSPRATLTVSHLSEGMV
jgi:hypothetical protein